MSQIPQKPVLIDRRLKFKFNKNQPYLNRGLDLNRSLNSLNLASVYICTDVFTGNTL